MCEPSNDLTSKRFVADAAQSSLRGGTGLTPHAKADPRRNVGSPSSAITKRGRRSRRATPLPGKVAWAIIAAVALCGAPLAVAVVSNDNLHVAGAVEQNVLVVRMVAGTGTWRPEGRDGVALEVAAFGEEGGELSVPGPAIKVRAGSMVAVTLRNALDRKLVVAGLCSRPGKCDPVWIPAGTSREFRFVLNAPGTYYYWASTGAARPAMRSRFDSQLGGAIIVSEHDDASADRVFVISTYDDPLPVSDDPRIPAVAAGDRPRVFTINGTSWPHTERLSYATGQTVHWRIVNIGNIGHAMHLHGYHFQVDARGDGVSDETLAPQQRVTEVTEVIGVGRTFAMSWVPTRPGNWLFHCHMIEHMAARDAPTHASRHDDGAAGMAGLVLGIHVTGPALVQVPLDTPRRIRMLIDQEPNRYGNRAGFRVAVDGGDAPKLDAGPVPGPVLVLHRGEPVEIEVVNRMSEPTAIHWHGIELESYYDGVPGYAGDAERLAPPIAAGASFIARFTPPRSGTFIYHTHWHDEAQLAGGVYGPLLVLEPGERYDPSVDHVLVIALNGVLVPGQREPFALNGRDPPAPIAVRAGVPNRLRLINITPNNSILNALLFDRFEPAQWTLIAKDGATLSPDRTRSTPARQLVSVGETYDFEFVPKSDQNLWLEIRRGNGEWLLQAPVLVR